MARARTTTPLKSGDARSKRSAEAMHVAFLRLIDLKPLEQISIKEITDAAGVSYPVFFRRYADKTELLHEIATDQVRTLLALGRETFERDGIGNSHAICQYVHEHRGLWTVLLNGGASHVMREEFKRIAKETAYSRPQSNPWLPVELAVPLVTGAIFEILAWWLRQPASYPLDKVEKLMDALVVDVASRPRNIDI